MGGPRWACFPCLVTSSVNGGTGWSAASQSRLRAGSSPPAGAGILTLSPFAGHVGNALSADAGEDAGKEGMEVPETPGKAGLYCRS